jgi:hypothetical protein
MRFVRAGLAIGAVALLLGGAAAARDPQPTVSDDDSQGALTEPADPDDAADIQADRDPGDVGQKGLSAGQGGSSDQDSSTSDDSGADD